MDGYGDVAAMKSERAEFKPAWTERWQNLKKEYEKETNLSYPISKENPYYEKEGWVGDDHMKDSWSEAEKKL